MFDISIANDGNHHFYDGEFYYGSITKNLLFDPFCTFDTDYYLDDLEEISGYMKMIGAKKRYNKAKIVKRCNNIFLDCEYNQYSFYKRSKIVGFIINKSETTVYYQHNSNAKIAVNELDIIIKFMRKFIVGRNLSWKKVGF